MINQNMIGLYCSCGCSPEFRLKYFGLVHWWKYTKLRYYWRNICTWLGGSYVIMKARENKCWVDGKGIYSSYPGPCMTEDEFEHWFPKEDKFQQT